MQRKPVKRRLRKRRVKVGEISVVAHPHDDPDTYPELFKRLTDSTSRPNTKYSNNRSVEFADLEKVAGADVYTGAIYIYSGIDFDEPWYNKPNKREATNEELDKINIPNELNPEFRKFGFVFVVDSHRLYFRCDDGQGHLIKPNLLNNALARLLTARKVKGDLEEVRADLIADRGQVDAILDMHKLYRLQIDLRLPNGEDDDPIDHYIDKDSQNRIKVEVFKRARVEALRVTDYVKKLAEIAGEVGGLVTGWGKDEETGAPSKQSTTYKPKTNFIKYSPNETDPEQAMLDWVLKGMPNND